MALQTVQLISLDFHKNTLKSLIAKQYDKDTQIVEVKICDNGKIIKNLADYTYEVKILSPDNQYLRLTQDKYITVNNESLQILFPGGVFIFPGIAKVELVVLQEKKQLSTMTFNYIIEPSVYTDEEILSDQELLKAIEQYKEELNEYVIKAADSEWNSKESEINSKESETNAKESETNAKTSENNAKESEINSYDSMELSKHWAIGFQEEDSVPSDTHNSKYYANQSQRAADYAAYTLEHAKDVIEITQAEYDNLSYEEKTNGYIYDIVDGIYEPEVLSRRWAIGLSEDERIPTDDNNSKFYAMLSKEYSEIAKDYTPEGYQELIVKLENITKSVYSSTEPVGMNEDDIWYKPY